MAGSRLPSNDSCVSEMRGPLALPSICGGAIIWIPWRQPNICALYTQLCLSPYMPGYSVLKHGKVCTVGHFLYDPLQIRIILPAISLCFVSMRF